MHLPKGYLIAVSYTHLDVYKRQVLLRPGKAFIIFRRPLLAEIQKIDGLVDGIDAVSYTHLDVYKRQPSRYTARLTAS